MILSASDLKSLQARIEKYCGIEFSLSRSAALEKSVIRRMRTLRRETGPSYLELLENDAEELASLVESITNNETSFYRHAFQFEYLMQDWLPPRARSARAEDKTLTLWSGACSNGSEAYSLAIACLEVERKYGEFPWKILGTDIDREMVALAETGIFGRNDLRSSFPGDLRTRYLHERRDGTFEVKSECKRNVSFYRLNLVRDTFPKQVDLIILRNVLYYLAKSHQERVFRKLKKSLKPEGLLLLSPTDVVSHLDVEYWPLKGSPRGFLLTKGKPPAAPPVRKVSRLTSQSQKTVWKVRVPPTVTSRNSEELKSELQTMIQRLDADAVQKIILDFRACTFLDSDALLVLTRAIHVLPGSVQLECSDARPSVRRALENFLDPGLPLSWTTIESNEESGHA